MQGAEHDFERWRSHGEADALARVFDATAPGLLRFAMHLVGDASTAEDLVQETFLTALRRADAYEAGRPVERWLAGILARHAQEARRVARRIETDDVPERADPSTPLDALLSGEQREVLARALDRLEEPYRTPAVLHYLNELSPAAVAHALGRSPGAVRVQLHRARAVLERALPAGIAGALIALALPARGLGSVRNQVLREAAQLAPAVGVGGGVLAGAIVMKKLVVAAVIVLALCVAWWSTREGSELETGGASTSVAAGEIETVSPATEGERALAPAEPAARAAVDLVQTSTPVDLQPFRVRVIDGKTEKPVVGARVRFYPLKRSSFSEVRARWPERVAQPHRGEYSVHDWPWFRERMTAKQRLDVDPVLSYEAPQPGEAPIAEASSGADGDLEVALPPEQAFLLVEHPDYASRGVPPEVEYTARFVGPGGKAGEETFRDDPFVVRLLGPTTVRGQLIDVRGEPVAARVELRFEGWAASGRTVLSFPWPRAVGSWTVWTSSDGSFAVDVAAESVHCRSLSESWAITNRGLHPVRKESWYFSNSHDVGSGETLWIPVVPRASLVVRSARDGAPLKDYWVQMREMRNGWPRGATSRIRSDDGRTALVDESRFLQDESADVEPFVVHVFAEGFVPGRADCANPIASGDIEIRLEPGECPRVEGVVLDAGRPVEDASAVLVPSERQNWDCSTWSAGGAVHTDSTGRFAFFAAPGSWVVAVEHAGRSQCRLVEVPCAKPVEIDLARDTAIEVVVEAPEGVDFARVQASIESNAPWFRGEKVDEHGRARFGSLSPGRYSVRVHGPEGQVPSAPGESELELTIGTTRTVHFTMKPPSGPHFARLVVDGARSLEGWTARKFAGGEEVVVEPDGRIPIDLSDSVSRLLLESSDHMRFEFVVPLEATAESILRVPRERGGYSGVVRRVVGTGLVFRVEAYLRRDESGLQSVSTPTDSEGRFRLVGLPPESRQLSILGWRQDEEVDGFASLRFTCAEAPAHGGRELVIEVPQAIDPRAAGPILVRGFVRRDGAAAPGLELSVQAILDQVGGKLRVGTKATVLSDGRYSISTVAAPLHEGVLPPRRGGITAVQIPFTIPAGVTELEQDFDLP